MVKVTTLSRERYPVIGHKIVEFSSFRNNAMITRVGERLSVAFETFQPQPEEVFFARDGRGKIRVHIDFQLRDVATYKSPSVETTNILAAQQAIVESAKIGIERPRMGLRILLQERLEKAGFLEVHLESAETVSDSPFLADLEGMTFYRYTLREPKPRR